MWDVAKRCRFGQYTEIASLVLLFGCTQPISTNAQVAQNAQMHKRTNPQIPPQVLGIEEALVTGAVMRHVKVDKVLVSPLTRALETCALVFHDQLKAKAVETLVCPAAREFRSTQFMRSHEGMSVCMSVCMYVWIGRKYVTHTHTQNMVTTKKVLLGKD